jgi:hypothetical protein
MQLLKDSVVRQALVTKTTCAKDTDEAHGMGKPCIVDVTTEVETFNDKLARREMSGGRNFMSWFVQCYTAGG